MNVVVIKGADAAQLLLDSGLLGEINRVVLHPRGLALSVEVDPADTDRALGFSGLCDYRDDPTGISFDPDFGREIDQKLAAYDLVHPRKV